MRRISSSIGFDSILQVSHNTTRATSILPRLREGSLFRAEAGGGPCLGEWQTFLWYQGRSRVVPEECRGAAGAARAILSIANAYATQPLATPMRPSSQGKA